MLSTKFLFSSTNVDDDVISIPTPQGRLFATPQQLVQAVAKLLGIASTTTVTGTTTATAVTTAVVTQTSIATIAGCIPPLPFNQCPAPAAG